MTKYLLDDLRYSVDVLSQHLEREEELLAKLDFTASEEAVKFLKAIKCDGRGDASQAVLDGMNGVLNLKWSNNSLKLVLHLFESL